MAFFRGMMGGGAAVETVVHTPQVHPGGAVHGVVNARGGSVDRDVNFVEVALVCRVEVETNDSEYDANVVFHRHRLTGPFRLPAGARVPVPFTLAVPWETPFNVVGGTPLHKVRVGLRTELDIARSVDKTDVDPLQVHALPAQERVVAGLAQIGFRFKGSDVEKGRIRGAALPFYQEVEFHPAPQFRGKLNELEVTFVAGPTSMEVVLELDRRSLFDSSDKVNRFTVDYATAEQQDWAAVLDEHIARVIGATGMFGAGGGRMAPRLGAPQPPGYGQSAGYGQPPTYGPPPTHGQPAGFAAVAQPGGFTAPPGYGQPPGFSPPGHEYGPPAHTYAPPSPPPPHPPHPPQAPPATTAGPRPGSPLRHGQGGGISLSKGGSVNLSQRHPGLSNVLVGLGWDAAAHGQSVDIDASAVVADAGGRALSEGHFVFFNNLSTPDGAVAHSGDNTSGAGSGDDEQLLVNLARCPAEAAVVAFAVSLHSGGGGFGAVRNAYIRAVDRDDGRELARFDLSTAAHHEEALLIGELRRAGGDWTFTAVGRPVPGGLAGFARGYGLRVD